MEWKRSCLKHYVGSEGGSEVCMAGRGEERRGEEERKGRVREKDKGKKGRKLSWSHLAAWKPEQKDPQRISFLLATIHAPGAWEGILR